MVKTYNSPIITPFVVILISIWVCVAVLLWPFSEFEFIRYYLLMYVFSLGILELASSFSFQLPPRKWLNRAIATGFVGWILCLLMYFS